ncbi:MAG: type II secretion system protein [Planctomycetota bacterium]
MKTLSLKALRASRRAGLTLIELVVVLTILVAVGGLLVPVIGNALTRSHVATCASNIPETSKMLIAAQATLGTLGDNWTTGVIQIGVGAGDPVNDSASNTAGGGGGGGSLTVGQLTAGEVAGLNDIGITTVFDHGDPTVAGFDVTFNADLQTETVAVGTDVIVLDGPQAAQINLPAVAGGNRYIWLGIDRPWTLLGTLTPEAPVHFGDTEGAFPNQAYSRFGAIFEVSEADASAEFRRVSYCLDGSNFETADNHVGIYWDEVQGTGL